MKTQLGEVEIKVPRDRNGSYGPKLIGKYSRNADGMEEKILALYACGMSQKVKEDHRYVTKAAYVVGFCGNIRRERFYGAPFLTGAFTVRSTRSKKSPGTGAAYSVFPELPQGLDPLLAIQVTDMEGVDFQYLEWYVPI